ncbi:ABC transporter ATP-binding protein [Portibacter marinus]|uniref:ABC transporter ATP-binding protein n=1 Tax=Portibacter marinus TaxID=2898660 RepID=UPI001F3CC31B|nr:ABC transporter ATP-binding protein [Portibacter marinus]
MKELSFLNQYFLKYKWRFLLGIIFVSLSNYFRVLMPVTIREALDFVFENIQQYKLYTGFELQENFYTFISTNLILFGGLVLLFAAIMGVFMYFMRQTIIVMSRLIEYDMRKLIFNHYQGLDTAFYKKNKTGDLMSRITEDVSKVRMYLGPAILYGINLVSLFAIVIVSMFRVSTTLTLWTLLPLPFLSLSIYIVSSIIHSKSSVIQKQLGFLTSISQEVYSGIRIIKSYVQEGKFAKYFLYESNNYKNKSLELARVNALFFPLMLLLISISTIITIYVGGLEVVKGNITPGNIAEFVIYVNMLTWPVTSIGWIASIIQQASASQERINEFLDTTPTITSSTDQPFQLTSEIKFENVDFVYPDTGIQALSNINLTIGKGEKIAIIGRTASGKTSIAELILRMYDVTGGKITIDGQDIKDINLDALRQDIAYVPQDLFLFSDTIENNIGFGIDEYHREEIEKYAEYASINKEIKELPNGYDALVGERGVTLSGGQKQRISIARALIKKPDIVILDDCLSAVDTKTEQKILSYLKNELSAKTAIIITHRIQSLIDFDQIIVLDEGQIVERGKHKELIDLQGYYYDILEQQQLEEKEIS